MGRSDSKSLYYCLGTISWSWEATSGDTWALSSPQISSPDLPAPAYLSLQTLETGDVIFTVVLSGDRAPKTRWIFRYQNGQNSSGLWLSWLECTIRKTVAGLIPRQGTYLGCRFNPQLGRIWEAINQCFSLTLMFLSLSQINKHILSWGLKK